MANTHSLGDKKILAHLEHVVVSNVQRFIPEGVQTWWRNYRQALEEGRRERTGEVAEVEVVGHGVEEAEERTKQEGASKCLPRPGSWVLNRVRG